MKTNELRLLLILPVLMTATSCSYYNQDAYKMPLYSGHQAKPMAIIPAQRPETPSNYYLENNMPQSQNQSDKTWINTQKPENYTIEFSKTVDPASTAKTLFEAPKTQRIAQYRFSDQGDLHFRGVYGSFSSFEEAEHVLSTLPPHLRNQAQIAVWSKIQNELNREGDKPLPTELEKTPIKSTPMSKFSSDIAAEPQPQNDLDPMRSPISRNGKPQNRAQ